MSFFTVSTASVICKHDSDLRKLISIHKRARANKNYVLKETPTEKTQLLQSQQARTQQANKRAAAF